MTFQNLISSKSRQKHIKRIIATTYYQAVAIKFCDKVGLLIAVVGALSLTSFLGIVLLGDWE